MSSHLPAGWYQLTRQTLGHADVCLLHRRASVALSSSPTKLIYQPSTAQPPSISRHNVKMTIWGGKKVPRPKFSNKRGGAACGYRGGGCGALELSAVPAITFFIFKRENIKDVSFKGGGPLSESLLCLGGIQVSAPCIDVEHRRETHFPILISSCPAEAKRALLQKRRFIKDTT